MKSYLVAYPKGEIVATHDLIQETLTVHRGSLVQQLKQQGILKGRTITLNDPKEITRFKFQTVPALERKGENVRWQASKNVQRQATASDFSDFF